MKYLLMIYLNPSLMDSMTEDERGAVFAAHDAFQKDVTDTGELLGFAALADPTTSTTVRVRDDGTAVTDGPYVEAKEFLAGYYVVDCETQERANELAARLPDARLTAVEVRPVMEGAGVEM